MSKLSYIHSSYGKPFGIAVANTTSYNVLNSKNLPSNILIVASPIDSTSYEDFGIHSLLATDFQGNPLRLTYEISQGNGLVENKDGSIELKIDNTTIKENEFGQLYVDLSHFVKTNGFELISDKLAISTNNMPKSSSSSFGVIKTDAIGTSSNQGTISIQTQNLDLSDGDSDIPGIILKSSNTINVTNGILSVNTSSLSHGTETTYGIVKTDGNLLTSYNGSISFDVSKLDICSSTTYGLASVDGTTIVSSQDGTISANFASIAKASPTSFGIVCGDDMTTNVYNGVLEVKGLTELQQSVLAIGENIAQLNNRIITIEDELANLSPEIKSPMIFTFVCDGLASATLVKPTEYGEVPEKMPVQKVTAKFIVNTNCPFKITLQYIDNVDPEISLYEINYNDVDKYPGVVGLTRTYQSTEEKDVRISLSWLCKNYRTNKSMEYSNKTRVLLKVMFANDITINKEVKYSITRFNSLYNEKIDYSGQNDEIIIDQYKDKINKHFVQYDLMVEDTGDFLTETENEEENVSSYIVSIPAYLQPPNRQNGVNNATQSLLNIRNNTSASIYRYIVGKESTKKPITKQQINDGRIIIDSYKVSETGDLTPTSEAELTVNSFGNIILNYKGSFTNLSNDYIIGLDYDEDVLRYNESTGHYEVIDPQYIWCAYYDNGLDIPQNIQQILENVTLNKYTSDNTYIGSTKPANVYVTTYEGDTITQDAKLDIYDDNITLTYTGQFVEE